MDPFHDLPSFPCILLSNSIERDDIPLRPRITKRPPVVISFSSFHNHQDRVRIRVEEVDSKLRSDVVNLGDDDNDLNPNKGNDGKGFFLKTYFFL